MSARSRLSHWLSVLNGTAAPRELPPRAERRRAARQRHREGGPLWTNADRHLSSDGGPGIADTADTGGLGKPILKVGPIDGPDEG